MTRGRAFVTLALAALAVPLAASPAVAQLPPLPEPVPGAPVGGSDVSVTMELQDPGLPLIPTRPYSLTLTVRYNYGPGGLAPPAQRQDGVVCGEVTVPAPPPWATVKVLPPELCFIVTTGAQVVGGTTVSNTTIVEINVTEDAPALEPFNFTVVFDSPPSGTLAAGHGETSRVISPGFVGRLRLDLPPAVSVRGGAPQRVPVTVHNLGNGPVEVRLRNATAPQGLRVVLPDRFVIEQPGGQATVDLVLEAPWTAPVRGQLSFMTESMHAQRPDLQGDTPRARLDVDGKAAVPGAELAVLLLALAGSAVLHRRQRR